MLAISMLLATLASAAPDLVKYDPGENGLAAQPLEQGEGSFKFLGLSQYQLSDRLQLRSAALFTPVVPNLSVLVDLGEVGTSGHLSVEAGGMAVVPWFGFTGAGVGGMVHYTHATNNYRPDFIHLNAGLSAAFFTTLDQNGSTSAFPVVVLAAEHDGRLNDRARLLTGVTAATSVVYGDGSTRVLPFGWAGIRYLHLFGPWRVGAGAMWTAPALPFFAVPPRLAWWIPRPRFEASVRF